MNILSEDTGSERGHFFEMAGESRPCWSCQSDQVTFFNCSSCTAIQQFLHDTDYFTSFNMGYKLNIDLDLLEKQYYELSRRFHPDYFQQKPKEEQEISLGNTAFLNKGYQTLKNPQKRAAYLVSLVEGDDHLPTEAPAELFEDIFEIQETLEEIRALDQSDEAEFKKLKTVLDVSLEKMREFELDEKEKLHSLFVKWDCIEADRKGGSFTDEQKGYLPQMKQILSHTAYLDRIINDMKAAV